MGWLFDGEERLEGGKDEGGELGGGEDAGDLEDVGEEGGEEVGVFHLFAPQSE